MGGEGSGRKPDETKRVLQSLQPIANTSVNSITLPDYSGVTAHDKTTLAYDDRYVNVTGDLMTGALEMQNELTTQIITTNGGFRHQFRGVQNWINSPVTNGLGFGANNDEQFQLIDGEIQPTTTNDVDLGDATHKFKDAYFAGNVALLTINGNTPKGYTLKQTAMQRASPADSTTYYFGSCNAFVTTADISRIYIPATGTITGARVFFNNSGILGSNQTSSVYIRVNNTTDHLISSFVRNDAASASFAGTLSISVNAGDYIEFKWVTPAWGTNPTNVFVDFTAFVE